MSANPEAGRVGSRRRGWMIAAGSSALLILAVAVTAPLWIRGFVESWASATLGRAVSIGHLSVSLGRYPVVTASQVAVSSDQAIPATPNLVTIQEIAVKLDPAPLLQAHLPAIPDISITGMEVTAVETQPGVNNYTFSHLAGGSGGSASASAPPIGVVHIHDSHAHIVLTPVRADLQVAIRTEGEPDGAIVADVTGTYDGQPMTGKLVGGEILNLRDAAHPYPVDVKLASGQTHLSLTGSVQDPMKLTGANLKMDLAGQDLAMLYPLTGIPIPPTPPYRVTGALAYAEGGIRFTGITGRLGSSDLNGDLAIDTKAARPVISGALSSRRVDLQDLAGFIGSQPGRLSTPGQTPAQRQAVAQAIASPRLIPDLPMDIPKIRSADFHLTYRGDSFIGSSVPFDNIATRLDIDDGHIQVTGLRVGIGRGQVVGEVDMSPVGDSVHTRAMMDFQRLDVARLLSSLKIVHGDGTLGGRAQVDAMGKSLSEILIRGKGALSVFMAGGNVSALIVDLSGLQFADAALAALGLPNRAPVRCFIADMALAQGSLQTRSLILDTPDNRMAGQATIDMRNEQVLGHFRTDAKHFTIGSLPTQINVSGTLKDPHIAPDAAELGARTAGAVGLGLLFPLAALLPTIQLGTGDDNACTALVRTAQAPAPHEPARRTPR